MYIKFTYSQYSYLRDGGTISVRPKTTLLGHTLRLKCCTFNLTKLCNYCFRTFLEPVFNKTKSIGIH